MDKTKKRINLNNQFLEQAVFSIADGYCSINLTKDLVPGVMHQVVDGVDYDLNEQLGMPENSSFSELGFNDSERGKKRILRNFEPRETFRTFL